MKKRDVVIHFLIWPIVGIAWGGSLSLAFSDAFLSHGGIASTIGFYIGVFGGLVGGLLAGIVLRVVSVHFRRFGTVAVVLLAIWLFSGSAIPRSFVSAVGMNTAAYDRCVALEERGAATPHCEELLSTPASQRSASKILSFVYQGFCWGLWGLILFGVWAIIATFCAN